MTTPKVSVIVPIYNAEDTLKRCVDSLLAQTFKDYEIILVDDGSPDRCGAICDEYAQKDSRIKVIHKPNGGVSSARQCGIDHAQGEFTIHADPDDWVESDMLRALYDKAKETQADMVICDFYENTYKGQKYIKQEQESFLSKDLLKDLFLSSLMGSTWNKLIRKRLYTDNNILFPREISFCEDKYVIAAILQHDIEVAYLPQAFYHYVRELNQKSLSRNYNEKTYQKDLIRRELFDKLLKDGEIRQIAYDQNSFSIVSRAFHYGKDYFTSKSFKKLFYHDIDIIKKSSTPAIEKKLMVWACCGYYQFSICIFNALLLTKHKLC